MPWRRLSDQDKRGADKFPTDLVLVGGGDPLLRTTPAAPDESPAASLTDLADQTANALKAAASSGGETPTTLSATVNFDDSLFTGPRTAPSWPVPYVTSNLCRRLRRSWSTAAVARDPARTAATTFVFAAEETRHRRARNTKTGHGIVRCDRSRSGEPSALSGVVTHTLTASDNTAAERCWATWRVSRMAVAAASKAAHGRCEPNLTSSGSQPTGTALRRVRAEPGRSDSGPDHRAGIK